MRYPSCPVILIVSLVAPPIILWACLYYEAPITTTAAASIAPMAWWLYSLVGLAEAIINEDHDG